MLEENTIESGSGEPNHISVNLKIPTPTNPAKSASLEKSISDKEQKYHLEYLDWFGKREFYPEDDVTLVQEVNKKNIIKKLKISTAGFIFLALLAIPISYFISLCILFGAVVSGFILKSKMGKLKNAPLVDLLPLVESGHVPESMMRLYNSLSLSQGIVTHRIKDNRVFRFEDEKALLDIAVESDTIDV